MVIWIDTFVLSQIAVFQLLLVNFLSLVEVLEVILMLHLSLVRDVVEVVLIEDNFLNLFLGQQRREEIGALNVAVVIAHMICSKCFSISCHLFLQDQKVHDLVEHCQRGRFVGAARVASFCKLVSCLFSIHFEWFNTASEHVNFFENASQITLELLLKHF